MPDAAADPRRIALSYLDEMQRILIRRFQLSETEDSSSSEDSDDMSDDVIAMEAVEEDAENALDYVMKLQEACYRGSEKRIARLVDELASTFDPSSFLDGDETREFLDGLDALRLCGF